MSNPSTISKETLRYGDHSLQTVSVTTLSNDRKVGYWVIFIHGGAWRDPRQDSSTFDTTQSILLTSPPYPSSTLHHITAFASIDYRLSPHPDFPQDQAAVDPKEYRNAKHPDHIHDVEAALALLQSKYGFGERYILVGHSCGATMSFQTVMGSLGGRFQSEQAVTALPKPTAILGVAGIYDLRLLRDTYKDMSAWQEFIVGAFGSDEALWDSVSPAWVEGPSGVESEWTAGRLAVLAHSPEDGLVDASQGEAMRWALTRWEKNQVDGKERKVVMLPVKGQHDDPWEKGEELARAIAVTVEEMRKMGLVSS